MCQACKTLMMNSYRHRRGAFSCLFPKFIHLIPFYFHFPRKTCKLEKQYYSGFQMTVQKSYVYDGADKRIPYTLFVTRE